MNTISKTQRTLGSIIAVAVAFVATGTLPAMADGMYMKQAPRMKRKAALPSRPATVRVIEKIIERPVIVEKVIEKQVFVDRPVEVEKIVEKQVCVEKPVEIERKVVVEHPKHKKHLIHLGIPFIGLDLF